MIARKNISSGTKWEAVVGYSRAVRVGNTVHVSGTVGIEADGSIRTDAYSQARRALEIITQALTDAGATITDVVRTRLFLVDINHFQDVARAHSEIFAEIRPATTVVEVPRLVDPTFLVEIEADAVIRAL